MTKQERQAIAAKKWYEKNKVKLSEQRKGNRTEEHQSYYERNKEYFKLKSKAWQVNNPEKMKEYNKKSKQGNPQRNLFNKAKGRCKLSGLEFSISKEDIIIPEYCPLLNIKLDSWGHKDYCPSLDRIDNTKGYTKDNIWVISFKANRMKNTATKEELLQFAESILNLYKDI